MIIQSGSKGAMTPLDTEPLVEIVKLNEIDYYFAQFIRGLAEEEGELLFHTAIQLSHSRCEGHICLYLDSVSGRSYRFVCPWNRQEFEFTFPTVSDWVSGLTTSRVVGNPDDAIRPLILEENRLYLQRYWNYERELAVNLVAMSRECRDGTGELPESNLVTETGSPDDWSDEHRRAAVMALTRRLLIISGGPGTGKTTSVAWILYRMLMRNPEMKICLTAPTGKAAARLNEAIEQIKRRMESGGDPTIIQRIPANAMTIHRLLESLPHSASFRRRASNPLEADLVVADEASMIDLALMSKLCAALKPEARLILLGDEHQLSSVEAGSVFGDLCRAGGSPGSLNPSILSSSMIRFTHSRRFPESSPIHYLSRYINQGMGDEAIRYLDEMSANQSDPVIRVHWVTSADPGSIRPILTSWVTEGYRPYLTADQPEEALRRFNQFRILTVTNEGPWGVGMMNDMAEKILHENGLIAVEPGRYEHQPLMILKNHYPFNLFNGDVGIVGKDATGMKRVYFPDYQGGKPREFIPSILPPSQTVFAMTVHKSQGMEFDHVVLVLPEPDSKALCRELIYTAVTRTRDRIVLVGQREAFLAAVQKKTERGSGLAARLNSNA
ncbi:MAG: exodeoxyribonuclease V subunit alpha [Candidatus Delongbacteria bacterium]|nr:exodeoxyribonuclease V subunit alpha [Candidatus Delongbacteria bacterium]